jgi:DNA-binding CsgD family transcriptional regulator
LIRRILFIVSLLLSKSVFAQEVKIIASQNGLMSSNVNAIVQDDLGFVWLGTKDGLYRYNEGRATRIEFQEDQQGSNNIKSLHVTSNHKLLIGLNLGGLVEFDLHYQKAAQIPQLPNISEDITINSIVEDSFGTLWLGTLSKGIWTYSAKSEQWKQLTYPNRPENVASCFDFAQQGDTMWLATNGDELLYYLYSNDSVFNLETSLSFSSFRKSVDVYQNKVVFGVENIGAIEFYNNTEYLHSYPCRDVVYFEGNLWISTDGDGIWSWDGLEYRHYTKDSSYLGTITDQYYSFAEVENTLWVGTYNGGAAVFNASNSIIQSIPLPQQSNFGTIHSAISLSRLNNEVYVGYDGDGFFKFQNDRLHPFFNASSNQKHPEVITSVMMDDLDSSAWLGTYSQGLWHYSAEGEILAHFMPYEETGRGLLHGGIWSLEKGYGDSIWIGTLEGIQLWNGSEFINPFEKVSIGRNIINDIHSFGNAIWIATQYNGIIQLDDTVKSQLNFGFPVLSMQDFNDYILVGTEGGGLHVIDSLNTSTEIIQGARCKTVYSFSLVNGRCFAASDLGLLEIKLDKKEWIVRTIATLEDLNIGEFNRQTLYAIDGDLLIGGTKGLFRYYLNRSPLESIDRLVVTRIIVDDSVSLHSFVENENARPEYIELSDNQNTVQIDFELISPEKVSRFPIQYTLDGNEVNMNDADRSLAFSNLAPGKHDLRITLFNSKGGVLDTKEFIIHKKAMIWKYVAFRFFAVVIFLLAIATSIVIKIEQRKREVKIQLLETESKLLAAKASEAKALLSKSNTELEFQLMKTSNRMEILRDFKARFERIIGSRKSVEMEPALREIQRDIERELKNEVYWDGLQDNYYRINSEFVTAIKTKYPQLTKTDLDLIILLKKSLSSKEIAAVLNITIYAVRKRKYRIKKKLGLNPEDSLFEFLNLIKN